MKSLGQFVTCMLLLPALTGCGPSTASSPAPTEPYTLSATVDPEQARIGDVILLTVHATYPDQAVLRMPELADGKRIVVRDQDAVREAGGPGLVHATYTFHLSSFLPGKHTVSTNLVTFTGEEEKVIERPFPGVEIEVVSLVKEAAGPRGTKPNASWERLVPRWIVGLLAVLLLAAGAALIALWLRSRQLPPPPLPVIVLVPEAEAIQALDRLAERQLIEQQLYEPFYVELSDIIRHYLESKYHFHAPERTTEEFLREVAGSRHLFTDQKESLRLFLEQCDLVKFARHAPGQEEMTRALEHAYAFVNASREPGTEAA